ncbi:hypothetical protein [Zhouia amylolytica]|nr:hypothetical protein [Zhouia amylolytica]
MMKLPVNCLITTPILSGIKFISLCCIGGLLMFSCSTDNEVLDIEDLNAADAHFQSNHWDNWEAQVQLLTNKTRSFYNFKVAKARGWNVDASGYVPQMGHHFVNEALMDDVFEMLKPEALLYAPDEDGNWEFLAVEYLVFPTNPEDPGTPPEGFLGDEDVWFFNTDVGAWTLHVWVRMENPDGVFAASNPLLE